MMSSTPDEVEKKINSRPKRGVKGGGAAAGKTPTAVDVAKTTTKSRLAKKMTAANQEEAAVKDDEKKLEDRPVNDKSDPDEAAVITNNETKSRGKISNQTADLKVPAVKEDKKKSRGRPKKTKSDPEEARVNDDGEKKPISRWTKKKADVDVAPVNNDGMKEDLDDTVQSDDETVHAGRKTDKKVRGKAVEATMRKDETNKKKVRPAKKKKVDIEESAVNDDEKQPKGRPVKKKAVSEESTDESPPKKVKSNGATSTVEESKETKHTKSPNHQVLTERDEVPKLWNAEEHKDASYTFKIASWNVAGIRALLRNSPDTLPQLCKEHDLDVLCLQETKLQESHLDDPKLKIRQVLDDEYVSYWSCSTAKKGYSGTAVFVKRRGDDNKGVKKQATLDGFFGTKKNNDDKKSSNNVDAEFVKNLIPTEVSYKMGVDAHDQEGRLIHVDFPLFSLSNVYVPNSGQKLERLDYRTEQWDKDLVRFVKSKGPKPTVWLGDLNVAHTGLEVWNDGAKHLAKQAGVTEQERQSFTQQLQETGFQDAFRALHPEAKGCYSYWSTRAGNRQPNKGLRLDYFCCSPNLFHDSEKVVARDSYILYDVHGSDHCPIVLELEIKK